MIATQLEWKRAYRTASGSRTWESRCGCYQVHAQELCYGVELRPVWYLAFYRRQGWNRVGGRYRTRQRAEQACQQHANRRRATP